MIGLFPSLESPAGSAGTIVIRNLDMSAHRVLSYPAPPPGKVWSSAGYFTEALFDTDESSIEFVLVASSSSGPGDFAVFVFREDGTELFAQNPGNIGYGVPAVSNGSQGVFMMDGQAYMVTFTSGPIGGPTRVFDLPGALPCMDCYGTPTTSGIGLGDGTLSGGSSRITLFPNPASQAVTVALGGSTADAVSLHDAAGALLRTERTNGKQHLQLSTAGLAQGRYLVLVRRGGMPIATLPLVIER